MCNSDLRSVPRASRLCCPGTGDGLDRLNRCSCDAATEHQTGDIKVLIPLDGSELAESCLDFLPVLATQGTLNLHRWVLT